MADTEARVADLLSYGPPLADAASYHRHARALAASPVERPLRVAVLSSYTIGFLEPFLKVELQRLGSASALYVGGFGEIESLWLDRSSALHAFQPDVVVLALRLEDMRPDATIRVEDMTGDALREAYGTVTSRVQALLEAPGAPVGWTTLVANFAASGESVFGVGDGSVATSRQLAASAANAQLRECVVRHAGAYVWDYAGLVAARGAAQWRDDRLWFLGRIPVAAAHHGAMAQHLARTIRAATQPSAKVLVLDLDNTLWGGVVGDDGVEGLKLGDDYPGNVFKAVQRLARGLRDRGVLLVIASKNDQEVAREAIETHPEMLLRWDDFAAHAISWGPKSAGIAAMAEQLGLGLDAFVFLDDNPVERAEVQSVLPTVKIIDVEAWGTLPRALSACPWFDQLAASTEDFQRAAQYAAERQRQSASEAHGSLEDYLASLGLEAVVAETTALERQRVAQLFAKTNQFNLTLRRPPEAVIGTWMGLPDERRVLHMRLADRFGDHGIIATAVLVRDGEDAVIDAFVMSCRVMNRRAEHAFLAYLAEIAEAWGCVRLVGDFVPGPRNSVVQDLYPSLGFTADGAGSAEAAQRYVLALAERALTWPSLVQRRP